MKRNSFRDLNAYKESKVLVKMTYQLLKKFPSEEKYALCEQIRRAFCYVEYCRRNRKNFGSRTNAFP